MARPKNRSRPKGRPIRKSPKRQRSQVRETPAASVNTETVATSSTVTPRPPFGPPRRVPTLEELFGGPRPASFSRGLEPAFLLIDKDVMDHLRARALELGLGGYDSLAKRILREHAHEY